MSFTDKRVVITGAASGIGLGIAKAYTKEGALVFMADSDAEKAENVSN